MPGHRLNIIFAFLICALVGLPGTAHAAFTDIPTAWTNFDSPTGYTIPYTFNGQPVADDETEPTDTTDGGSGVSPAETDLSSGSPNDANSGPYDTPSFGYYNGGTLYDPDDPATMEDDYIRFTMRINGDPRPSSRDDFTNYHWNVLLDLDDDGYKEFWIDLHGKYSQKDANGDYYDRLQILYDDSNNQEIDDPDAARVDVFSAYNNETFVTSHTRVRPTGDGTGEFFIDMQIPMTAFKDTFGNQILFPDSPVGFVFTTGANENDPLQKDFMTDLGFLTSNDPIFFGDIVRPNGQPNLHFADSNLEEKDFYTIGDNIYLYLRDPLANTDPNAVEWVTATVTDPVTGDDETVILTESGPNSGIFSNLGGATKPVSSDLSNAWIPYVKTTIISVQEDWTVTYVAATGEWTVTGSVSGLQAATVTAGTEYTSDNGEITFTLYEVSPSNGDTITFTTYAGDALTTSTTAGADDDGDLQVASGHTITYSYTNVNSVTTTDTAAIVGYGEPFIQFTRAEGTESDNFELGADLFYVTVYHEASNTNSGTIQSITVTLSGSDNETLTLYETGPNTGIFRNTDGLVTEVDDGTTSPTPGDDTWTDVDQGAVTATFTYGGTDYTAVASVFYIEDGGRVYFTNGAGTFGIDQYSAGQPVFVKVEDGDAGGCITTPLTVTITSSTGDSETVTVYETGTTTNVYINRINELITTAGSAVVTLPASPAIDFSGVSAGDSFVIANGPDAGTYTVASVQSNIQLTLTETLSATGSGIGYNAYPLMAETYDGVSYTAGNGILEAADGDTLTVTYLDCNDGDDNTANDYKTDTADYNAPPIVINEVLFHEDTTIGQHEFIQLYNATSGDIDVTGYTVSDGDSFSYDIPQSGGSDIILESGQKLYVVLIPEANAPLDPYYDTGTDAWYVFATGDTGTGTGYDNLGDPDDADTGDQISLYNSSGGLIDYVAWSTTTTNSTDFKGDDADAVAVAAWTDNAYRNVYTPLITAGQSIRRETDGVDNDVPADWVYATASDIEDIIITFALISSFRVYSHGADLIVEWETTAEVGTLGFYLFRRDDESRKYIQLNEDLLPGLLHSQQGGTYRYLDETTFPEGTLTYKLVEVETGGRKRAYGPFRVTVDGPGIGVSRRDLSSLPMVSRYDRTARGASVDKQARTLARKTERTAFHAVKKLRKGNALKIVVIESGLYYVGASEIADAMGISLQQCEQMIRHYHLDLSNQGYSVAYMAAEGNSGIYFYGEAIDSIYTRENIYWLSKDKGIQMAAVDSDYAGAAISDGTFVDTIHFEEDHWPLTRVNADPKTDYWRWDYVLSGYAGFDSKTFTIQADGAAEDYGTAVLTVYLQAETDTPADPDHHVRVYLNGTEIMDAYWDGTELQAFDAVFDSALLNNGENRIEVIGLLDTGVPYSLFYVDAFDLTYHRYYEAVGDRLKFRGDENDAITVGGFSNPDIYLFDITDPGSPELVTGTFIDGAGGEYRVSFSPIDSAAEYLAIAIGAMSEPVSVLADAPSSLKQDRNWADYLVITPFEFKDAAQTLADFRQRQGLATMVVVLEDIMDEFNNGIYSPEAIRDFLSYAYHNWTRTPRYVLLAGEGTFDYRDVQGYGDNLTPPLMVGTPDGLFASDNRLADVAGDDGVPEMAIGRLPAMTSDELHTIIDKIVAYETAVGGEWMKQVLLLADDPDNGGDFPKDSNAIAAILPPEYTAQKIYLSEQSIRDARRLTLDGINDGALFLNYFGHGGMDRLAGEGMLTTGDVASLENSDRLPVITAMTCIAGRFALPGYDSIAEALLLREGGGAVAMWSPTGLSENSEARILNEEFYRAMFGDDHRVLGDSVLKAFEAYRRRGSSPYMLDIYNLLGDPALRVW